MTDTILNNGKCRWLLYMAFLMLGLSLSSCGIYSFKDVSIPPNVKTVHINLLGNHARYINPQVAPKLTDALVQKITSQTKLTLVEDNNADYQISGNITGYNVTTSGVSSTGGTGSQTASLNRLTVQVHIVFIDATKENKKEEFDISRDFDFSASLSLQQAENSLMSDILKNTSEEIFNHIFSNW